MVKFKGKYEDSSKLFDLDNQVGGWLLVPHPPGPPVTSAAAVVSDSYASCQHPTSSTCQVPLFFCFMALDIPSTEIAQKHGRTYDLRSGGNINQEGILVGG